MASIILSITLGGKKASRGHRSKGIYPNSQANTKRRIEYEEEEYDSLYPVQFSINLKK